MDASGDGMKIILIGPPENPISPTERSLKPQPLESRPRFAVEIIEGGASEHPVSIQPYGKPPRSEPEMPRVSRVAYSNTNT